MLMKAFRTLLSEEKANDVQKVVDSTPEVGVDCQKSERRPEAIQPTGNMAAKKQQENAMTLTYKDLSKNGKRANYTGILGGLSIPLTKFAGKQAPSSIEVSLADGSFVEARTPKAKLTKEERAALPKPTLAERIAKREAQLAKDKAKLEAQSAGM